MASSMIAEVLEGRGVLVLAVVVVTGLLLWEKVIKDRGKLPLPPRPPGYPILGNAIEFIRAAKKGRMHLLLEEWARQYGEIVRVQIGPVTQYYLNSDRAVKQIMDKAAASTSQRPRWIVSNELLCNKWNVLLLDASDPRWKLQRKVTHSEMTSIPMADAGLPFLYYETAQFLHEVIHDPAAGTPSQTHNLWLQIGRYTYSTFSRQSIGFSIPSASDPKIKYITLTGTRQIEGTLPGSHLVDILPILEKLPMFLKPWEREARRYWEEDLTWVHEQMLEVQKKPSGEADSLLLRILHDEKRLGMSCDNEVAYLGLMLTIGAADTSRMSTWSFLLAMMMFPEVQTEAHSEIDKLVGHRIPVWEDFENSEYFRCLVKEIWRWRPPVALGHPHTTTREIEYEGMRIPKGARLHLNAWAIHHDPSRHENPSKFWPQRYLGDSTTSQQSINASDVSKRDHFAFGAGRRICPGVHVAERSLSVAVMRILWAFDVRVCEGVKVPLDPEEYSGFMPGNPGERLPVVLVPRCGEKVRLVDEAWAVEKSKGGFGG